jgi:hypothetical protein
MEVGAHGGSVSRAKASVRIGVGAIFTVASFSCVSMTATSIIVSDSEDYIKLYVSFFNLFHLFFTPIISSKVVNHVMLFSVNIL